MKVLYATIISSFFCFLDAHEPSCINENLTTDFLRSTILHDYFENKEEDLSRGFDEGTNITEELNFVAISLGSRCGAAGFLRDYHIRSFACPFDWCITPYKALYNFIDNEFEGFFIKENLVAGPPPAWFFDKESGMAFPHDFQNNTIETMYQNYDVQHAKYLRRITRFYNQISSGKYIYFIRIDRTTKIEACNICSLLINKFPQLSFTLIVLGEDKKEFYTDWKVPHVRNYLYHGYSEKKEFWDQLYADITSGALQDPT